MSMWRNSCAERAARLARFRFLAVALSIGASAAFVAAQVDVTTDHLQRAADLIRKGELSLAEKQLDWVFKREPRGSECP